MREVIDTYSREEIKWIKNQFDKQERKDIEWKSIQHKINAYNIKIFSVLIVAFLVSIATSIAALVVALEK